ncbi:MAG: alpha/beta hydrolase [Thermomicrobiales bacterium]
MPLLGRLFSSVPVIHPGQSQVVSPHTGLSAFLPPSQTDRSERHPESIVYRTIDGYQLTMDLFVPSQSAQSLRPAVVLLHGGGWVFGISGPQDMAFSARRFAEAGYVAATVGYRRTGEPKHPWQWPDPLHDVQDAVRWLRTHADRYAIDPMRIVAYGHSAGAHLATMLAVRDDDPAGTGISSRVNGAISLAGHMDLRIPYVDRFARDSLRALLGEKPNRVPDRAANASPLAWVDRYTAPMLLLYGHADSQVPPAHHRRMADALRNAGVAVTVVERPDADHFSIAEWSCAGSWALAFIAAVTATPTCSSHSPGGTRP